MKHSARFFLLGCLLLAACADDARHAGGGDDFPNTLGPVLARSLDEWGENRSLRPDQQGVDSDAAAQGLAKSAALAKTSVDWSDTADGRVTVFSLDTALLRITADTVVAVWPVPSHAFDDSISVVYFAHHVTRRNSGAYEWQRMIPLDSFIKAPGLDSSRIHMQLERSGWRSAILEGSGVLRENVAIHLVHFPQDTLRNYPLYYRERLANDRWAQESRLLSADGDTVLVPGADLVLRKVWFKGSDSVQLAEVGVIPGPHPWHGSARYHRYRAVDYAPGGDWLRSEVELNAVRGYAEGEEITEGSFRMMVSRPEGRWTLTGTFSSTLFTGALTGPDGRTESWEYLR